MKFGLCLTPIYPQVIQDCTLLERLIERLRDQKFFQCVELYFEGTQEEQNRIRRILENTGLEAVYLGGLPIKRDAVDISARDERVRKESVDACKRHIEYATCMGCGKIVIGSGPDWKRQGCEEQIAEQTRKSLEELDCCAEGMKLEISVEPFPSKTEPCLAVGNTHLVWKIFHDSQFHNVGLTFDTSHFRQMQEDIEKSFHLLQPWIHHVHLANCVMKDKNNPLYGDKHPCFSQEDGEFTVESIGSFYRKLEKQGMLTQVDICSLEIISRKKEDWYYREACQEAEMIWG